MDFCRRSAFLKRVPAQQWGGVETPLGGRCPIIKDLSNPPVTGSIPVAGSRLRTNLEPTKNKNQ
jgi:hypothetical protein